MCIRDRRATTHHLARDALHAVTAAAREVMGSGALMQLLAALLAHGNFLNAETVGPSPQSSTRSRANPSANANAKPSPSP
eukprot:6203663-Prymnesium_polylepis.1